MAKVPNNSLNSNTFDEYVKRIKQNSDFMNVDQKTFPTPKSIIDAIFDNAEEMDKYNNWTFDFAQTRFNDCVHQVLETMTTSSTFISHPKNGLKRDMFTFIGTFDGSMDVELLNDFALKRGLFCIRVVLVFMWDTLQMLAIHWCSNKPVIFVTT